MTKYQQSYFDITQGLKGQKELPPSLNIYVNHLIQRTPMRVSSLNSINQSSERSLDIDDLPHGPLLPLVVPIKPYYDPIAQWTKTYNYLPFLAKACSICLQLHTFETLCI